eukprot:4847489-Pyramimonas_sp.AAC.1
MLLVLVNIKYEAGVLWLWFGYKLGYKRGHVGYVGTVGRRGRGVRGGGGEGREGRGGHSKTTMTIAT